MAAEFSIGVVIKGMMAGSLLSAIGGTQKTLKGLESTTARLKKQHADMTQELARNTNGSTEATARLNRELQSVGRTLENLKLRHDNLANAASRSAALPAHGTLRTRSGDDGAGKGSVVPRCCLGKTVCRL